MLQLALAAIGGVVLLLFLVMVLKLHAFLAIMISAMVTGILSGMDPSSVLSSIEEGMGSTLGFVAVVVGLGTMFGKMLEISGGTDVLADTLLKRFGERSQWALSITGFLVAIPVFLDVGFVILVPIIYSLSEKSKKSLLYYAIPLLAGLAVTHAMVPPTPGPTAIADILHADLGMVTLFGIIIGLPTMAIAGPLFGRYIGKRIDARVPEAMRVERTMREETPSFSIVLGAILLPIVLMVLNSTCSIYLEGAAKSLLGFIGHPFSALTIATVLSLILFRKGFTGKELRSIATSALAPAGIIILVTGAGGAFKQVLIDSGIGDAIAQSMGTSVLPPLVIAFFIACAMRLAQGSATVAMITSAGIVAPLTTALSQPQLALLVISIASGATIFSHVNDSGFWLVNQYLGLSEVDTIRSWSIMETIIALCGFSLALVISLVVG
ncbi:MAG: gluconate:H+ symporter [Candidatus Thermoplasmatota archaeon]|nr:gluconate:H+ symporter [Candidatus Thermoplasmatota archaeon]